MFCKIIFSLNSNFGSDKTCRLKRKPLVRNKCMFSTAISPSVSIFSYWDYRRNDLNENDLDEVNEITDNNKVYSNVTSKEALECFYKIKGFVNDNNPEGLTKLFDFEDELYKGIDKTIKTNKNYRFFLKKLN